MLQLFYEKETSLMEKHDILKDLDNFDKESLNQEETITIVPQYHQLEPHDLENQDPLVELDNFEVDDKDVDIVVHDNRE